MSFWTSPGTMTVLYLVPPSTGVEQPEPLPLSWIVLFMQISTETEIAAAVLSARRAGTTASWDQLNKYFGLMQMPIITSRYWNMVHGTAPEEVRQDLEGMQTMRVLGRNMAFFLRCKEVALAHGLELPIQEPFQFTNFIR